MNKILEKFQLLKSEFVRNVLLVMTGTAISQVIAIAVTPILTRNYSPDDFGFLLIYLSILTIAGTCSTGKYEKAILIVKTERNVKSIIFISLVISVITAFILFLIILFAKEFIIKSFDIRENLYSWLFTLPFLLIIYSEYNVLKVVLNFQRKFKTLSLSKVVKTISSVIISLFCIFFFKDARGLILGEIFGFTIAFIYVFVLTFNFYQFDKNIVVNSKIVSDRYKRFPIFSIPSDFMNMASFQMPAFFLTSYFGAGVTGFYSLMKRVLDAPIGLLSSSILEVFRQKAAEEYLQNGNCKSLFIKTAKNLVILSVIPFIVLFLTAPNLFSLIFGNEWFIAGKYARILSLYYFFKFISSPLSYMFYIAEKQNINFVLQLYLFVTTIIIFNLPKYISISEYYLLGIYSINLVIFYIILFVFSYSFAKNNVK
ncbi:lipopolysaccharide biosynthesis protein [Hyunsoonleella pacifica]|uniref:Lipopolysaccharide biosynthesis protein n=1 Tax=Hyunsoonleella pacifica TaxID=1080224 RepID=A0A4Q9FPQ3_9FLAO|nr:oligosaccharide flippase family protein [Hyunsoonleella pacifica]TBN16735.1 hypothetical protein EYD46_08885 [Hyunsoonleella pacifica]GGD16903.1 polysaccharide biosynthesis protein [Hyunsoonleella pacifica]